MKKIKIHSGTKILKAVCKKWKVSVEDVLGRDKRNYLVFVRAEVARAMAGKFPRIVIARTLKRYPNAIDNLLRGYKSKNNLYE